MLTLIYISLKELQKCDSATTAKPANHKEASKMDCIDSTLKSHTHWRGNGSVDVTLLCFSIQYLVSSYKAKVRYLLTNYVYHSFLSHPHSTVMEVMQPLFSFQTPFFVILRIALHEPQHHLYLPYTKSCTAF